MRYSYGLYRESERGGHRTHQVRHVPRLCGLVRPAERGPAKRDPCVCTARVAISFSASGLHASGGCAAVGPWILLLEARFNSLATTDADEELEDRAILIASRSCGSAEGECRPPRWSGCATDEEHRSEHWCNTLQYPGSCQCLLVAAACGCGAAPSADAAQLVHRNRHRAHATPFVDCAHAKRFRRLLPEDSPLLHLRAAKR